MGAALRPGWLRAAPRRGRGGVACATPGGLLRSPLARLRRAAAPSFVGFCRGPRPCGALAALRAAVGGFAASFEAALLRLLLLRFRGCSGLASLDPFALRGAAFAFLPMLVLFCSVLQTRTGSPGFGVGRACFYLLFWGYPPGGLRAALGDCEEGTADCGCQDGGYDGLGDTVKEDGRADEGEEGIGCGRRGGV